MSLLLPSPVQSRNLCIHASSSHSCSIYHSQQHTIGHSAQKHSVWQLFPLQICPAGEIEEQNHLPKTAHLIYLIVVPTRIAELKQTFDEGTAEELDGEVSRDVFKDWAGLSLPR